MALRTTDCPVNGLNVIAVDEDEHHANYIKVVLPQYNYHVAVYTSPIRALNFLKDHAQDVDFLLVAVDMEEISGFQFLDIAIRMHQNIQVIMMSATTTIDMIKRSVKLGACFLANKPLGSVTIRNLWQHVDIGPRKIEIIENFIRGSSGKTHAEQSTIKDSSDYAKSKSINNSKVQSSIGSNSVNMSLINYSNFEDGEVEKNPDEGSEDSASVGK